MIIIQIIEAILKFIVQVIFGIAKVFAWLIDATGFTHITEKIEDPDHNSLFNAADDLEPLKVEEKKEVV